jgi:hypothetical protein
MSEPRSDIPRIAIVWPGDPTTEIRIAPETCRLHRVFDALRNLGASPEPAVYRDDAVYDVRRRLLAMDGVLIWVNPIEQDRDRSKLDEMLRDVAAAGVFVSAHPDVILKMGTKQVLYDTRDIGWGCDTHVYHTISELQQHLPECLAHDGARVLKQYRGNGGNGVWKAQLSATAAPLTPDSSVRVRHAQRGAVEMEIALRAFFDLLAPYFERGGRIIDQAYQERLTDGMIRCYLVHDRVVGFGHQAINMLFPAPPWASAAEAPQPGPRLYYGPAKLEFQPLKCKLENEWFPAMKRMLGIDTASLPVIWDADFLLGPRTADGQDTYVLCEINVSSVYPFPDDALVPLAEAAVRATLAAKSMKGGPR